MILYGRRPFDPEGPLTIDEAIRELLDVSTDITSVAVVGDAGEIVACEPGPPAPATLPRRPFPLWEAAQRAVASGDAAFDHVVVPGRRRRRGRGRGAQGAGSPR